MMTGNGLAKLIEECGELMQVAGKRLAYYTINVHPDGGPALSERLEDEIADVLAACALVGELHGLNAERVAARSEVKLATFKQWHAQSGNNEHGIDAVDAPKDAAEWKAAHERSLLDIEDLNDCICEIASHLGVDSDAPLADIVSELVEALPQYELLDGTGDMANVRERAEYAADEWPKLRAAKSAAEAQHATASEDIDRLVASLGVAEAALVEMREAALAVLAMEFSIEAGTYAESGSGRRGEKSLAANIAALSALHSAAHGTPADLAARHDRAVEARVLREAASLMSAAWDAWEGEPWGWLRALADEKERGS